MMPYLGIIDFFFFFYLFGHRFGVAFSLYFLPFYNLSTGGMDPQEHPAAGHNKAVHAHSNCYFVLVESSMRK